MPLCNPHSITPSEWRAASTASMKPDGRLSFVLCYSKKTFDAHRLVSGSFRFLDRMSGVALDPDDDA
jgi:hypothetical protein